MLQVKRRRNTATGAPRHVAGAEGKEGTGLAQWAVTRGLFGGYRAGSIAGLAGMQVLGGVNLGSGAGVDFGGRAAVTLVQWPIPRETGGSRVCT
jgi:hypothetical protein